MIPDAFSLQITSPLQQAVGADCDKIKQEVQALQDAIAQISAQMQMMQQSLDRINRDIATLQQSVKFFSGPGFTETIRGEMLDKLARAMNDRTQIEHDIEDAANKIEDLKSLIAELLNQLANCAPPSTSQPPQEGPSNQQPASPPQPPRPSAPALLSSETAAPNQQSTDHDCDKIKQEIQSLQDAIAQISTHMQIMQQSLDRINNDIATLQQSVKFFSAPGYSETIRGEMLDKLARAMNDRTQIEHDLEDAANKIEDLKSLIADLLNQLANCAPPSTTQPPKQETPTEQPPTPPPSKPAPSSSQTSMSTTGAGIQFQLRGFGGASFINGNTPATSGFDGAVLFPLGNRILVGPSAGFQWVDSSIVGKLGGGPPPSTFIHTSAGFKQGNFGGGLVLRIPGAHLHTYPWMIGIHGGATVAGSTITQAEGFCGGSNPTAAPTCTVIGSTTTHDTVTGPFVGGYISHSIFSHVGVFVGYDYVRLQDTKPNPTNPSGPPVSVFDLHYNNVVAGITLTFGRYHEK